MIEGGQELGCRQAVRNKRQIPKTHDTLTD